MSSTQSSPTPHQRRIREVAIRYVGPARRAPESLTCPAAIAAYLRRRVRDDAREHLVAIYLDARGKAIGDAVVSIGTAQSVPAHPRDVFQIAVALGACAVVLGHSHPSGDPTPSDADLAVTERLAAAGALLGIELLDHIVWTREGLWCSIWDLYPECLG